MFLNHFLKKLILKKSQQRTTKHEKLPSMQRVMLLSGTMALVVSVDVIGRKYVFQAIILRGLLVDGITGSL